MSNQLIDEQGFEVWDSTKLSAYADCEMLGKLQYEEHLVPNEPAVALIFGAGLHKAVETWTKLWHYQLAATEAEAVAHAEADFLKIWEEELPQELREMLEFSGDRRSFTNFRRLFTGFRKKFPLGMYEDVLGCEVPFTVKLGETPAGRTVKWSGLIDRIVKWQGGIYYVDVKTSSFALDEKFFNKWKLSGQLRGYSWASRKLVGEAEFAGAMVQGVHVQAPLKTKQRAAEELVQAEVIPFTESQLEEWRQDVLKRIDVVHLARDRGHLHNYASRCGAFGGGCEMRSVCWTPPEGRDAIKQLRFHERVWDPRKRGQGSE